MQKRVPDDITTVDAATMWTSSPQHINVLINQATVFMHFFNISVFHIHNKYIKLFSSYDTALNIFYTHHFFRSLPIKMSF